MSDWHGTARTNYVLFKDLDGLKAALEPFPLRVNETNGVDGKVYHCIDSEDEYGGWPSFVRGDDDEEHEFLFEEHVTPYMEPGQTLITMECGSDRLKDLTGDAWAYFWNGQETLQTHIRISDIAEKAAAKFGIPRDCIAHASGEATPQRNLSADDLKAIKPADQRWEEIVAAQGWIKETKIIHLEGFLAEKGMLGEFVQYAQKAAAEENAMTDDSQHGESIPRDRS